MTGAARLLLHAKEFPSPSQTFLAHRFQKLLERGWDVHVLCDEMVPEAERSLPLDLGEGRIHVARTGGERVRCVERIRPDVLHFEFGHDARRRLYLLPASGCALVVSFQGYDICIEGLEDDGHYWPLWDRVDAVHFPSTALLERARERGLPASVEVRVIPPITDLTYFSSPVASDGVLVGTVQRPLRVLFVGRLHWKKGLEYGLEAIRLVREAGVETEFRVAGNGPASRMVEEYVTRLGLDGAVRLLGSRPVEDVRAQLEWADVFLMPSISEGFCCAVLEAQAMGVPVVTTDAEGLTENVADGETGFIVPRRDPQAMAGRLAELAERPGLRGRMGDAGRRRARSTFDPAEQLTAFEDLYRHAIDSAGLRRRSNARNDPFVSVVLPTEGRTDLLAVALDSLCRQTLPPDRYEVVVVEDGAREATAQVVEQVRSKHPHHTIRYIGRPKEGLNACRNAGVEIASGDPVVFTDDDVEAPAGWLAALVDAATRRSEVGAFGGPVWLRFEGREPRLCPGHPFGKGEVDTTLGEEPVTDRNLIGANLAIRRSAFDAVGGFDEDVTCGSGADSEWQVRWRHSGGSVYYVPDAWLWHRRTGDMLKMRQVIRLRFVRSMNDVLYWKKTRGVGKIRSELRKVPSSLHHALDERCEGGLLEGVMALGSATGMLLDRVGLHPLTRGLSRAQR